MPNNTSTRRFLTELEGAIESILPETATTFASPTPHAPTRDAASITPQTEIDKMLSNFEATVPARAKFEGNTLIVWVSTDLRLWYDRAPVQSFLIPRVLDAMRRLEELKDYEFDVTSDGCLSGIKVEFPSGLTEATLVRRVKRLIAPISWTLRALSER